MVEPERASGSRDLHQVRASLLDLSEGPGTTVERASRRLTYVGIFCIAAATLTLEVLLTRITSVIAWYHLAFFVISLAMLGMTVGAVLVFLAPRWFPPDRVGQRMSQSALWFAIASPLALGVAMAIPLRPIEGLTDFASLLAFGSLLAVPFAMAGVTLTLALTRAGLPAGTAYGVDLVGAATGCALVIPLLDLVDAPSAALVAAAAGAFAALVFGLAAGRRPTAAALAALALLALAAANASLHPHPLRPAYSKGIREAPGQFEYVGWNTFSRVTVEATSSTPPFQWAQSRTMPAELGRSLPQRTIRIDGAAATQMVEGANDLDRHAYLDHDLTSFAHLLRPEGPAAVIGVGGGRDVIVAARSGHTPVVGVELNALILDLHRTRMAEFSRLTELAGVELIEDEARSFFEKDTRSYRVITMSLIDTWASTGTGAYSLSENGLYTVEAWRTFMRRLEPGGIYTVSRWYHHSAPGETARMLALAMETLWSLDDAGVAVVEDPRRHIFLLQNQKVATLLISPSPFSKADIDAMQREAVRLGFNMLATPRRAPQNPILTELWEREDRASMWRWAKEQDLDVTPSTDDRPFFFNMLKPGTWLRDPETVTALDVGFLGNLRATQTLVYATVASLMLTLATIVGPLLARRRRLRRLAPVDVLAASAYFALIGVGFMFVEIGLLSRLSVLLGHPTLALAVLLGGIILFTGVGSLVSGRIPVERPTVALFFPLVPAALVLLASFSSASLTSSFVGSGAAARIFVATVVVAVPALGLGLGFPLGLRLCARLMDDADGDLGPWLWGINGAAGVCASGLALACSMVWGISTTLLVGAACYFALMACTRRLARP